MSLEREDSLSMYDIPLGDVPAVPIGQFLHADGNGHKRLDGEVTEIKDVASEVGAEVTDKPHGEHDSFVIRHRAWLWVGGAIGTVGITAAGIATAFAVEQHRRKTGKKAP